MAKQTIQERLIAVMKQLGETEVMGKSGRYKVFTKASGGFYYLGKHGALRIGPNITGSFSFNAAKFLERHEKPLDN